MFTAAEVRARYDQLTSQGKRLAGGLKDVIQRAATYHHLYEDSGGNHVFPLIAAHGALWSKGHFAFGTKLARLMVWQFAHSRSRRSRAMAQLEMFADAFREINRRVCVETYASYHLAGELGDHPAAEEIIPQSLLSALRQVHAAKYVGEQLSDADKRSVFAAFFLHEQQTVVGPAIENAVRQFDWPAMKWLALQPNVVFAYFRPGERLKFSNFANQAERVERGLVALDMAAAVGFAAVQAALAQYGELPAAFLADSRSHFAQLRQSLLKTA